MRLRETAVFLFAALRLSASPWHDLPADRPQDPAILWGRLDNGVRYGVMHNETPKGCVSLRLLVGAGSLLEANNQRGIAHFVEHMAFRGTRHFPHDKLLPILERMGLGFGPDTLAFTGYDFTEYRLELPDTQPATVQSGLDVFRDFAGEVSFDRRALNIERGVVLSEVDLRTTPQWGMSESNLEYLWPHSLLADRSPLGLKTQLLLMRYGPSDLRAFYNAWYRPERIAIIAVGDIDRESMVRRIAATFATLRAHTAQPAEPANLYPSAAAPSDVVEYTEPGWTGASLLFEHPQRRPARPSDHAQRVDDLHTVMAMDMFQRRLEMAATGPSPPFAGPVAKFDSAVYGWMVASCEASVAVPDLDRAVQAIEQEHRRAMIYGFTDSELAIIKGASRMGLRDAARTARTRDSRSLAETLESHLLYGAPVFSPAQLEAEYAPAIETTTRDDCLRSFRAAWSVHAPHVFLALTPQVRVTGQSLARALNASRAQKVERPPAEPLGVFDYANFGPLSALTADRHISDLDLHLAQYANGVALNFKSTPFEADEVTIVVRVGGGRSTVPPYSAALPVLTAAGFLRGGLGEFSYRQLRDILSGHDFQIGFMVDHDAFCFYGRSAREELPLALRYIAAYITDPAFRPEELHDVEANLAHDLVEEKLSAEGIFTTQFLWLLSGQGDPRYRPAEWNLISNTGLGAMAQWLLPQFRTGPVEVTLVGDIDWAAARRAMDQSLAQLRPRTAPVAGQLGEPLRQVTNGPFRRQFTTSPVANQACLCLLWEIPDVVDMQEQRRGYMTAAVLQERVLDRLRMELGRTYSPTIDFGCMDSPLGLSYLQIRVDLSPPLVTAAYRVIRDEVAALDAAPPSPDVFERAREPLVRAIRDDMRSNRYWAYVVLERACELPRNLQAPRTRLSGYSAITAADVSQFLQRHVSDKNLSVIVTTPENGR